jgi:hypothetical protein
VPSPQDFISLSLDKYYHLFLQVIVVVVIDSISPKGIYLLALVEGIGQTTYVPFSSLKIHSPLMRHSLTLFTPYFLAQIPYFLSAHLPYSLPTPYFLAHSPIFPCAFSYFLAQFLILMIHSSLFLPFPCAFLPFFNAHLILIHAHSLFHSHTCAYFLPSPLILFPMRMSLHFRHMDPSSSVIFS